MEDKQKEELNLELFEIVKFSNDIVIKGGNGGTNNTIRTDGTGQHSK